MIGAKFLLALFFLRLANLMISSFLTSPLVKFKLFTRFVPIVDRTIIVEYPTSLPTEPTDTSARLEEKSPQYAHPAWIALLKSLIFDEYSIPLICTINFPFCI